MRYYFNEISREDAEQWGVDTVFEHQGRYYEFVLEVDGECVTLRDTCDRYVPLGIDCVAKLLRILSEIHPFSSLAVAGLKAVEQLEEPTVRCVS